MARYSLYALPLSVVIRNDLFLHVQIRHLQLEPLSFSLSLSLPSPSPPFSKWQTRRKKKRGGIGEKQGNAKKVPRANNDIAAAAAIVGPKKLKAFSPQRRT